MNEEAKWHQWVQRQMITCTGDQSCHHSTPHTQSIFLPFAYSMFMPSLQAISINYALQYLGQSVLDKGTSYMQKVFNDMISLPFNFLSGKITSDIVSEHKALDSAIEKHMKNGEKLSESKDLFSQILESNQILMILLVSILSLYFQYKGMTLMKEANKEYQSITSFIDPEDDSEGTRSQVNSTFKKYIYSKYNTSSYYNTKKEEKPMEVINPLKYDPVRIVYNTLVGLNHALFFCMRGESDDPSHEILHWTKALLYWEILARLLRMHGIGPMQLASKLFLQTLWQKKGEKRSKQNVSV